jgi:fumarate reductase subunit D
MVLFIVLLYRVALGQLWRARESLPYATKLAALLGCTGILIHSLSDFNLHIPANAALFYVLAAIATRPGLATDQ